MNKKWEHVASNVGWTLVFAPYDDEEEIAYVHRDLESDDWILESELLNSEREFLCDGRTPDDEMKRIVEEMVEQHYRGEINYYTELLEKFKGN